MRRCSYHPKLTVGKPLYNIHGLHAYINDTQQHIQNIARVADLFGPVVGIVGNAAFLDTRYCRSHALVLGGRRGESLQEVDFSQPFCVLA